MQDISSRPRPGCTCIFCRHILLTRWPLSSPCSYSTLLLVLCRRCRAFAPSLPHVRLYPRKGSEIWLPHGHAYLAAPGGATCKADGDYPRSYRHALFEDSLGFLANQSAPLRVVGDEVVYDLGNMDKAIHRTYPDEHPEVCDLYHLSLHHFLHLWLVCEQGEGGSVVDSTVTREDLPHIGNLNVEDGNFCA